MKIVRHQQLARLFSASLLLIALASPLSVGADDGESPPPVLVASDVEFAPIPNRTQTATGDAPSPYQTSEYMAGSVTVSVVFAESSAVPGYCSGVAHTENWNATRRSRVLDQIRTGVAWWTGRANRPSQLSFSVEDLGVVPTSCEPINRSGDDYGRGPWVADVLNGLGYSANTSSSSYLSAARSLADARRDARGTDWSYVIFVVNSYNDADGQFTDGRFAYAWLNGPAVVMTYDNDGWGIDSTWRVTAHETGHIFGALDEYSSSGCYADDTSGYLNAGNSSCNYDGISWDESIMGDSYEQLSPDVDVSNSARAAVGWRNPSSDPVTGVTTVDVVRTSTNGLQAHVPDPTTDQTPTYVGEGGNEPYPPGGCNTRAGGCWRYPSAISISRVASVGARVDSGAWTSSGVSASDGSFNTDYEDYQFTPSSLEPGAHSISTRVINDFGHASSVASDAITISGGGSSGPANDNFSAATELPAHHTSIVGTNVGASAEAGEPINTSGSSPINSVWFSWTAAGNGEVEIDLCYSDFDTTLAVYTGASVASLIKVAHNDDRPSGVCSSTSSWLTFQATAGVTYHISIDGYSDKVGTYEMTFLPNDPSTQPSNDLFSAADVLSGPSGIASGTNENSGGEVGEAAITNGSPPTQSVWYRWTAPSSGTLALDTCTSDFDTTLGVYTGSSVDTLTRLARNDDDPTDVCGLGSRVTFAALAGATYYFALDGYGNATGHFSLAWLLSGPDVTAPVVANPTGLITAPQTLGTTLNVNLSWPAATDPSGIASYELHIKKGTGAWTNVPLPTPTTTKVERALTTGAAYRFRVRATDGAGNVSLWAATSSAKLRVVQETSTQVTYVGTWRRTAVTGSSGGYVKYASAAGAQAMFTFNGTNAVVVATTGPARGIADVYIDGAKVGTIDFYSPTVRKKHIAWALGSRLLPGSHTLEVRVTGQRNSASTGARIELDAFTSWP